MKKLYSTRRFVLLGITGAALLSAGLAKAQPHNNDPAGDLRARTQTRVAGFMDKLNQSAKDLGLTDAQKAELKLSARKHFPEARAIWGDPKLTTGEKVSRIRALTAEARGVLTPEQRQKAEELKSQALAGVFSQMQWVSDELDLTGDQQAKIRTIVMNSVRKGTATRVQNQDGKPNIAEFRGLVKRTNNEINAVLTPEQRSKWAVIQSAAFSEFNKRAKAWRAQNA